jgi:hypothetical protein
MTVKSAMFYNVTGNCLVNVHKVSEKRIASVFRVEELVKQESKMTEAGC